MPSERSQIRPLPASWRIDAEEVERPLVVAGRRDRFLIFALSAVIVLVAMSSNPLQYHLGDSLYATLHSALPSLTGSEAFHHLHVFFIRFLGELP
jgi:hypothetical protein